MKYKKTCPLCGKEQTYSNKYNLQYALRDNRKCRSCIKSSANTIHCPVFNLAAATAYHSHKCRCLICMKWYKQYYLLSAKAKKRRKQYYQKRRKNPHFIEQEKNRRAKLKEYYKDRSLQLKYGIGLTEYNKMMVRQDGVCMICKLSPKHKSLCVDHDHNTKKVRGLLCSKCNLRLHNDFMEWSKSAMSYLNNFN